MLERWEDLIATLIIFSENYNKEEIDRNAKENNSANKMESK